MTETFVNLLTCRFTLSLRHINNTGRAKLAPCSSLGKMEGNETLRKIANHLQGAQLADEVTLLLKEPRGKSGCIATAPFRSAAARLPNFPSHTCRKHPTPSLQSPKFRFTPTNTNSPAQAGRRSRPAAAPAGDGSSSGKVPEQPQSAGAQRQEGLSPNHPHPGGCHHAVTHPSCSVQHLTHGGIPKCQGEEMIFHTRAEGITWDLCPPSR